MTSSLQAARSALLLWWTPFPGFRWSLIRGSTIVANTLERVCGRVGYPKTIRVGQGSQFISRDLDLWRTGIRAGYVNRPLVSQPFQRTRKLGGLT